MAKRKSKYKKEKIILASILVSILLVFSFLITFFPSPYLPTWNDLFKKAGLIDFVDSSTLDFSVHYLDVGQADCEIIISGDDVVLIDAGDANSQNTIKSYLEFQGIKNIDYFIITHPHADHIGSASEILSSFEVYNVIMPRYSEKNIPTTDLYKDLVLALNNSKAKVIPATIDKIYELKNFSFKILSPSKEYEEENDSSVVLKATYKNNSFLFCGDAEKKAEKDILSLGYDISANVIKLGHHGSSSSSSSKFLDAVNPQHAIISCGKNNKYNHPNESVLNYLISNEIEYKRTDFNGTIVASSDGDNVAINSER